MGRPRRPAHARHHDRRGRRPNRALHLDSLRPRRLPRLRRHSHALRKKRNHPSGEKRHLPLRHAASPRHPRLPGRTLLRPPRRSTLRPPALPNPARRRNHRHHPRRRLHPRHLRHHARSLHRLHLQRLRHPRPPRPLFPPRRRPRPHALPNRRPLLHPRLHRRQNDPRTLVPHHRPNLPLHRRRHPHNLPTSLPPPPTHIRLNFRLDF